MELLLTGREVTADEALRIGLIGRVVPDGGALDAALEVAEVIGRNGPLAVEAIKRAVLETEGCPKKRPGEGARDRLARFCHEDAKEGPRHSPRSASRTSSVDERRV